MTNVVSCYEISQPKPLFLGDMDDYIRTIDVPKGRFSKSGHIFLRHYFTTDNRKAGRSPDSDGDE